MNDNVTEIGMHSPVQKSSGYLWPGIVVADFLTLDGKRRVVVECVVPEVRGSLHIFDPNQLTLRDEGEIHADRRLTLRQRMTIIWRLLTNQITVSG